MNTIESDSLWYKDAIVYEVHVRAFFDSDRDGVGDFRGLTAKLDYLQDLGVTALWILPCYPSPLKDDGYDISDYMDIHPSYGTLRDFKNFLNEAHRRGLRVISELVLNHTSDRHPWFQRARQAERNSRWRDFYVWSDTPEKFKEARVIFRDYETSNWAWDPVAKAYYWHRFYSHQPDLNFDSPDVRHEIFKVVDFWLRLGVDGLRLDAVPYIFEEEGTNCENLPRTHELLKSLRQHIDHKFKHRMLIAEANQWPDDARSYFGDGDECQLAFHFPLMPRLFMAISMEDHYPITEVLANTPQIPENCQWAVFLRNHDELTLEMVTDEQRDYMYRIYARDERARINLGIRHRLTPLLGNFRRRIELVHALLFSLCGTPILYYGDEIGMGDNIYLGDRNGVRTPMQWSADRNAGFSQANPQRLYLPIIIDPAYHYEAVNVEVQQNNPHSLLWWIKRVIAIRKRYKAFGRGTLEFLHTENGKVIAFVRRFQDECILVVANLSRFTQGVELDLKPFAGIFPLEIFGAGRLPQIHDNPYFLTLGPHGFYWFSLEPEPAAPTAPTQTSRRIPILPMTSAWTGNLRGRSKAALEKYLPTYLSSLNGMGTRTIRGTEILQSIPLASNSHAPNLDLVRVDYSEGDSEMHLLPLHYVGGTQAAPTGDTPPGPVIASLKGESGLGDGLLYDATADPDLSRAILDILTRRRPPKGAFGELGVFRIPGFRARIDQAGESSKVTSIRSQPDSTSFVFGEQFELKVFKRVDQGVNPDWEVRYHLANKTSFANLVPVLGYVELRMNKGEPATLAILEQYVPYEKSAWKYTQDALSQFIESMLAYNTDLVKPPAPNNSPPKIQNEDTPTFIGQAAVHYLEFVRLLAERTAQMHLALSADTVDSAFSPEPITPYYQRGLFEAMRTQAGRTMELARKRMATCGIEPESAKRALAAYGDSKKSLYKSLLDTKVTGLRIRCNGDYQLGLIRYTGKDFFISAFGGALDRPLTERRIKRSPLVDVASILVSFKTATTVALENNHVRDQDLPTLETRLKSWNQLVRDIFLKTYLDAIADSTLLPIPPAQAANLLDQFLLDRAIYELNNALIDHRDHARGALQIVMDLI